MPDPPEERYGDNSRLILCEGESDNAFFRALMEHRQIPGFQVIKSAEGKDRFDKRLRAIRASRDFPKIKSILLVSDNDDNPTKSFKSVKAQIQRATGYGVPSQRMTPRKTRGYPSIVVLMFPSGRERGCLESLIVNAISDARPEIKRCLEDYARCSRTQRWSKSKRDKMLLPLHDCCNLQERPVVLNHYDVERKQRNAGFFGQS